MRLAFFILATLASQTTLALTTPQHLLEPCPSIEAIKQQGLNMVTMLGHGNWRAAWMPSSYYNTSVEWRFILEGKGAKNATDAMRLATETLTTLFFFKGPIADNDATLCYYTNGVVQGIASTPPEVI